MTNVQIEQSWKWVLASEFTKPYFCELTEFVRSEYQSKKIFPPPKEVFAAFEHTPFDNVRVVILGQDPYHGPGQAHGLCFSVNTNVKIPPSLVNIYKEMLNDVGESGQDIPKSGDLRYLANQGVLLLNATLTVEAHKAGSHQAKGWEEFTDAAIHRLAAEREHLVFILWGSYAQKKGAFIDTKKHLVLEAPHPSPLSSHRGFFGSKPFSQANAYLKKHRQEPIAWLPK